MLQQTRVETVLPYFKRFLKLFPDLAALAKASLQSVLKAWAGLGYYARARHLHEAAKTICNELGGKIPSAKKDLLSLPGFGPYTAGAVASLAFNEPAAALDGNVKRFLGRLLDSGGKASAGSRKDFLERVVEELIPSGRASDFNQAMMDLGAMICIPVRPRCPECPVKRFCAWGGVEDRRKKSKAKIRKEAWAVALVEQDGRFLLHPKEGKGLLAGLWQFPLVVVNENGISKAAGAGKIKDERKKASQERETLKKAMKGSFGLEIKINAPLATKEHQFTHIHVTMKPFLCSLLKIVPGGSAPKNVRWIKPSSFSHYPISRAMGKIAALILPPP
jgi:A/G-specific adenine glycosylase